jgi:hypothetical protein
MSCGSSTHAALNVACPLALLPVSLNTDLPCLLRCPRTPSCTSLLPLPQGLSHVLLRALSRAAITATSFDVPALLAVLQQTAEAAGSALLPSFLGGSKASLRQLYRPDGFFGYADDRQAQVG